MRQMEHVECMYVVLIIKCKIVVMKCEWKRALQGPRHRYKDGIKMDLK